MFSTITNIFKIADLRRKIIFTLLMLVVFRIGSFVPVPNINVEALANMDRYNIFGLLNTFSGGALQNFSIFAMGIMPYITASIIMQLLAMDVVPKFSQWQKEGELGRRKIVQFTRYGTILIAIFQSIAMSMTFNKFAPGLVINPSFTTYAMIAITLTAGTAFLMWLGEEITEKGIGNGISIIIFAGIVAAIPNGIKSIYASEFFGVEDELFIHILKILAIVAAVILIVVGVIYVLQAMRKVPVQYAKRVVGRTVYGGQSTHIPLKVNSAGVIPVIFALAVLIVPPQLAQFWQGNPVADWVLTHFNYQSGSWIGITLYVLLIIGFTYFYTFVQINPEQLADNMKKNGGFIPGIRPGNDTANYITRILNRITFVGALFLAAVSVLPVFFTAVSGLPQTIQIGGTSLLIVIGVALEVSKQVESQLVRRHYRGFIR